MAYPSTGGPGGAVPPPRSAALLGPPSPSFGHSSRPRPGDTWHLDEVFLRINGELHYLWRAVDQNGVVLDILVQGRRNATAAKRFFKRLLEELRYKPRRLITDGLRSYGVARREVLPHEI